LATSNKDFRIKNGLIVEGANATVSGNEVLTSASSIDDLSDVTITEPSNAQVLSYDAALSLWKNSTPASGGSGVTISATPPTDPTPTEGNLWFDSSNGTTYIYYDNFWVPVSPPIAGPPGPTGEPGIVVSNDEPLDTNVLWLDSDDPAISAIPAGGTTGQVLVKATNDNYNTEWTDLNTADISDLTASATEINSISSDTAGYTALSNGTSGITYQPISHNAIINGAFEINQRNFTSTTTGGVFGFDRWSTRAVGGTTTYSSETFTLGSAPLSGYESRNFARLVTTGQSAASDRSVLLQAIESVRTFAGQTVTVSFFARAASGTPSIAVELFQSMGSGGSPSLGNPVLGEKRTLSTNWQRFSVTIPVPSLSGKTLGTDGNDRLEVLLWVSAGSDFNARTNSLGIQSNTFDIWGVQLEAGSVATPFKRNANSLQGELAACQRYYFRTERISGTPVIGARFIGLNTITAFGSFSFPVAMRSAPTVSIYGASGNSGTVDKIGIGEEGGYSAARIHSQGFNALVNFGGSVTDGSQYICMLEAAAEL
jgi:hypothetical protein